jgi:hypothetical protein
MLTAAALGAAPGPSASTVDQAREARVWEIAKVRDMQAFAALLDPNFVAVYAGAINDRDAEIAAIGEQRLQGFEFSGLTSRAVGPDSSLVTYTVYAKGRFRGSDISGRYNAASLWRRDGGDWKLAYHGEVKAP